MHLAWKTAVESKDFDYYLWLNDDTFLFPNAFEVLLKEKFPNAIVCGTTKSYLTHKVTYGAFKTKIHKHLVPNGKYQLSDYCNGNCVLIPKAVFFKIGNLDPFFQHALGDFDYSMRARKNGIEIKLAPDFIGCCESHDSEPKWRSISLNISDRLKNLYHPLSGCHPVEYFYFDRRHNGLLLACLHFVTIHLRCFLPKLWRDS